jgi:hypothetical protein
MTIFAELGSVSSFTETIMPFFKNTEAVGDAIEVLAASALMMIIANLVGASLRAIFGRKQLDPHNRATTHPWDAVSLQDQAAVGIDLSPLAIVAPRGARTDLLPVQRSRPMDDHRNAA